MRLKGFVVVVLILLSLLPLYYLNRWLQKLVRPRSSFGRFILYMLISFALVFAYTFLVTVIIFKLIPPNG